MEAYVWIEQHHDVITLVARRMIPGLFYWLLPWWVVLKKGFLWVVAILKAWLLADIASSAGEEGEVVKMRRDRASWSLE